MFSGALFIKSALGFEGEAGLYISVLILLALAALFTIGGGLTAVIYTDFVQAILMVLGSIILTALGKILQTFGPSELSFKIIYGYFKRNQIY